MTEISLKWLAPYEANGKITMYKVCWRSTDGGLRNCIERDSTLPFTYPIPNLRPGTTYNISVSAFTTEGEGPTVSVESTTSKSGK